MCAKADAQVDGDLVLVDTAALRALQGEVKRLDAAPVIPKPLQNLPAGYAIARNHENRKHAQTALRAAMALWGGWRRHVGDQERVSQKRFFHEFGIDVMTAQTLNTSDANALQSRIDAQLTRFNVISVGSYKVDRRTGEIV